MLANVWRLSNLDEMHAAKEKKFIERILDVSLSYLGRLSVLSACLGHVILGVLVKLHR